MKPNIYLIKARNSKGAFTNGIEAVVVAHSMSNAKLKEFFNPSWGTFDLTSFELIGVSTENIAQQIITFHASK